jgi:hypothetical protein
MRRILAACLLSLYAINANAADAPVLSRQPKRSLLELQKQVS